jgi:tetratricopeptide (TPR) repeat protein
MKKLLIYMVVLFLAAAIPSLPAEMPSDHLKAGDCSFAKFDDAKALAEYQKAARLDPMNFEAIWKAGLTSMNVGDRICKDDRDSQSRKRPYYRASLEYAQSALKLNPVDSRAHFLFAASLARQVPSFSRKEQIAAAYKIREEIDRSLALDPNNDLAWHALAFWHRTLAEMGGTVRLLGGVLFGKIPKGSFEEAVKGFQKAIALNPNYCDHHLQLAQTYLDLKKKELAARELLIALSCPDMTSQCPHFKDWARQELNKLIASGGVSGTLVAQYASQNAGR